MKQLFAMILVLCLTVAVCGTVLAAGQDVLTVNAKDCAPGSTIEMAFGLKEGSGIAAANYEVTYDTDTFEFDSYEDGELVSGSLAVGNATGGKFLYATASDQPITSGGTLFTLKFKVDSKASGDHTFYFYTTSCCDVDLKKISVSRASAVVKVAGEAVSNVSVTPVTSKDKNESEVVVSADKGESATGRPADDVNNIGTISSNVNASTEQKNGGKDYGWLIAGGVVLGVALVAIVIVLLTARKKKPEKTLEKNDSILDDEAKSLLNMTPDALEDEDKE